MNDEQRWQDWKDAGIFEAFLAREEIQGMPSGPVRGGFVHIDDDGNPISVDDQSTFELRTGGTVLVPTSIISFIPPGENPAISKRKEQIRTS